MFFCILVFGVFNVNLRVQNNQVRVYSNDVFAREGGDAKAADQPSKIIKVTEIKGINTNITAGDNLVGALKGMFFGIIQLFAWMITFAVTLINFSLSEAFNGIFDLNAVSNAWKMVRDFLNIFFIFFLLFSAFATIFQVSKYHIKSTWVMIVVMALLVNFSWPITRVIIDMSNVTMEYIAGQNGGKSNVAKGGLMAKIGEKSQFAATIIGQGPNDTTKRGSGKERTNSKGEMKVYMDEASWPRLLLGIIFAFTYMITVFAIAAILIIRVVALAILLMFASIGFVMAAFPSTRSYANSWWSSLMKYVFVGPILLFMLFVAANIMSDLGKDNNYVSAMNNAKAQNTTTGGEYLQYAVTYTVPIVVLWAAIIFAGKLGDGASSMVVGKAGGAMRGAANKIKGGTWGKGVSGAKRVGGFVGDQAKKEAGARTGMTALKGRMSDKWKSIGEKTDARRDKIIADSKFTKDSEAKRRKIENDKYVAQKKKNQESGITASEAEAALTKTDANGNLKIKSEGEIRAQMETAMKGSDFGKNADNYTSLASSVSQIQNEDVRKEMLGKLNKSYVDRGNAHAINSHEIGVQETKIAQESGVDVNGLTDIQKQKARSKANAKIYSGMDAKTFAKQKETIKKIDEGSADFGEAKHELNNKLARAGFARDMQSVDSETYEKLERINNTHL